jgi:hypothetical protein
MLLVVVVGAAVALAVISGAAVAAPKVDACSVLTTDELGAALDSVFQPGSAYDAGTGTSCGFDGIGPVRGATVRVAVGKQAKQAMTRTLKALRQTLHDIDSEPPTKVAGLGDKAWYSLDEFLGEGSIEVLDGKTFVQVTAIVAANGDTTVVSESVLRGLAEQALAPVG